MTRNRLRAWCIGILLVCGGILGNGAAQATLFTNSWIGASSGRWETGPWSLGLPPNSGHTVLITNASTKTVTADVNTWLNAFQTTTITNLVVSGPVNSTNTLVFNTMPFFEALNRVTVSTNGVMQLNANTTLQIDGYGGFGSGGFIIDSGGTVALNNSTVIDNSDSSAVGYQSNGQMTMSNSAWQGQVLYVAAGDGSQGTLTMVNCTNTVNEIVMSGSPQATSTVWVTGGQLIATEDIVIGAASFGQMTVSNGTVQVGTLWVGSEGRGILNVAGGTMTCSTSFAVSVEFSTSTGTVALTGGELVTTSIPAVVGSVGPGQVLVTGGKWLASEVDLGQEVSGQGALTVADGEVVATNGVGQILVGELGVGRMTMLGGNVMAQGVCVDCENGLGGDLATFGGSLVVLSNLTVGSCTIDGGFAEIEMNGGTIYVTNAAHNAVLDVRNGIFQLNGGTLVVDKLVVTNLCLGLFDHTGGTLIAGTVVLDPNQDTDGDGLPNGWEQSYGLDPLSSVGDNGPNGDPDMDGVSNFEEFLDGTNPTLSPQSFRILSIAPQGNDIRITWSTVAGTTNIVQATAGTVNGSYTTNGFTNISSPSVIPGSATVTNSYLDIGGATNKPSRFYRVRLVP
jgi:hypothetical protein